MRINLNLNRPMLATTQALRSAARAFERIAETAPGERGRRAGIVALVLRAVEVAADGGAGGEFLRRRAAAEVEVGTSGAERGLLLRLMREVERGSPGSVVELLVEYAWGLEDARRLGEAEAVLTLARTVAPERAEVALRAARVARLQGDGARALALYQVAGELDGGGGVIARLAAVGEAVVAADPERALSLAIRRAVAAGDGEAAAVGLEERARVRRSRSDRGGAARDLCLAAARFSDAVDRARVAHRLADLYVGADDPEAAREALLFALETGDEAQREHARARLHTVSRDLGDRLGMRRWRSYQRPSLVSLSGRRCGRGARSAAPRLSRWRARLEAVISQVPG